MNAYFGMSHEAVYMHSSLSSSGSPWPHAAPHTCFSREVASKQKGVGIIHMLNKRLVPNPLEHNLTDFLCKETGSDSGQPDALLFNCRDNVSGKP